MPRYDFKALDHTGMTQVGSVDAANPNDVVRQLSNRGLRVQQVSPAATSAAAGPAYQTQVSPRAPVAQPQPAARQAAPVQAVQINQLAAKPAAQAQPVPQVAAHPGLDPVCKVKTAKDTDTFFLFAQLANLFRGGLAPTQAMDDMSRRTRNKGWDKAFQHIALLCSQGTALSVAMSVYDGIFNPGDIGAVAAGEAGGYLWQACEHVSEQAKSTMKLRRMYDWVSFVFWSSVLSLPLVGATIEAIQGTIPKFLNDASIADMPINARLGIMAGIGFKSLIGPWGWITVAGIAAFYYVRWYLKQPQRRQVRHFFAAKVPMLGARNQAANAEAFAFHLNLLQNAAISPHRAWALAAKAVPNVVISNDLSEKAPAMNETSRLSDGFFQTRLFPEEMGHLLQTGEMTGQVGRALEDSRQMSQQKAQVWQGALIAKGFLWIALILFAASVLPGAMIFRSFYDTAFKAVLSDTPEDKSP